MSTATYNDWRTLVEAELKGILFDKKMFTSTYEAITLKPIYGPQDIAKLPHVNSFPGFAPFVRGSSAAGYLNRPWDISQEINYAGAMEFNHAAHNALERGLDALNIVLDKATRNGHDPDWASPSDVGTGGLSVAHLGDLKRALDAIDLEKISLLVRSGASAMPFAALLVALARQRRQTAANLRGCIEMDPLGVLAHEGELPQSLPCAYREMATLTRWAADHAPNLQTSCVHSRAWHEAGGNAVQELAFTLATSVEYLREMSKLGLEIDTFAPRLRFAVTVGEHFFMEIGKMRALRMLWCRAVTAAGGSERSQQLRLHVRTSLWNKTAYDPYNNMIRATVETLAGLLGGCDSMQVGAFDECLGAPDDFSRRIARNTPLILQRECRLDRVIDPAGGCWLVENLTAELAGRAWTLFQEIEKLGGMAKALEIGFPQKAVAAVAEEKIKNITRRRDSMVGINQYANPSEKRLTRPSPDAAAFHARRVQEIGSHRTSQEESISRVVLEKLSKIVEHKDGDLFESCIDAAASGATLGEITRAIRITDHHRAMTAPVRLTRGAASMETLREAMDRHVTNAGDAPRVFLCNMGPVKDHKARADFARGFFAVGGFDVISPAGFESVDAAAQAAAAAKAAIVVICSTDEKYPTLVPPLAAALRAAAPSAILVLAGLPQDQLEAHKKSGVEEFIHIRADALETLTRFHARLDIQ